MTYPNGGDAHHEKLQQLTQGFIDAVSQEIERARAKFPSTDGLFAALSEEVGELARELDRGSVLDINWDRVGQEAMQVACVAIRIATEGIRPEAEQHLVYAAAKIGESIARKHLASLGQEA